MTSSVDSLKDRIDPNESYQSIFEFPFVLELFLFVLLEVEEIFRTFFRGQLGSIKVKLRLIKLSLTFDLSGRFEHSRLNDKWIQKCKWRLILIGRLSELRRRRQSRCALRGWNWLSEWLNLIG